MKKLVYILLLLVSTVAFSQSNTITYQAVIYLPSGQNAPGVDVTNLPMTNKNICLQFSFIDANNRVEYQEEIKVKTDEFGMVNLTIGNGEQTGGYASSFDAIVWNATVQKKLQVALDAKGLCNQFELLSSEPIASVPFANASITAANVSGIVTLANGGTGATTAAGARTNLGIGNVDNTSDLNKPISTATKTYVDTAVAGATIVDASTTTKGKIQLAGDLAGTAAAPTVPGLALKENAANKSTTTTLGTSDVLFPTQKAVKTYVDTAITGATIVDADTATKGKIQLAGDLAGTAAAPTVPGLALKENAANKSTITTLGTSDSLYPSQKAVKTYVDTAIAGATIVDADATTKGKIQLAGDLAGTAAAPTVPGLALKEDASNKSTTTTLGTSDSLYPTQKAVKTYVDTAIAGATIADADTATKGKIKLAGDLAGTADSPEVATGAISTAKLATNAVTTAKITNASVTNTKLDKANIPLSGFAAAAAAVDLGSNKLTNVSNPTSAQDAATKNYVDTAITGATIADADATNKGKIQLAGDLAGTAASPTVPGLALKEDVSNKSTTTTLGTSNSLYPTQNAVKTYADAKVVDGISDSVTSSAPSQNAVFDALALKANAADVTTSLALKEDAANKTVSVTTDGASDEKFPSAKAVKTYADAKVVDGIADTVTTSAPTQNAVFDALALKANAADVTTSLALKANLASPTFTGTPTAPTPATADNSTTIATTEYVKNSIVAANAGLSTIGAISTTSDPKGAIINGTTELVLTPADATNGGVVTTGAQTFAGAKTFNSDIKVNDITVGGGSQTYGNTALGYLTLASNQPASYNAGSWNTAIGHSAMYRNTNGNYNTAIGKSALTNNTTGKYNTAIGYYAGSSLYTVSSTFPTDNTLIGTASGMGITTGSFNTIIGSQTYNVVNGTAVGIGITTGSNNTIIGSKILGLSPSLSNNIILADGQGNIRAQHDGTNGWTLGTISSGTWNGTEIAITKGGTGAITAAAALTNLGAEPTANKSTATDLGNSAPSDVLFPSQKAVKAYVDSSVSSGAPDATTATSGKIKLAGDLSGTAALPTVAAGAISEAKLAADAVTSAKIKDGEIVNADVSSTAGIAYSKLDLASSIVVGDLADNAVETAKIKNLNVTTDKLAANAVTTIKIADDAVTTLKITDANVTAAKLASDAVETAKIKDLNITTGKLAADAVTSAKIKDGEIVNADVSPSAAIAYSKLDLASSIVVGDLADDAVETAKIKNAAVETAKLADGSVTTVKLATDAVTTLKITDANVTAAKLASDAVETAKIKDLNVTTGKLAADAVTSAKIKDGEIVNADVSPSAAIAYSKLNLASSIVASDLANNAVETNKIKDAAVEEAKIKDAAVTYAKIQNVSATDKVLGRVSTGAGVVEEIATTGSGNVVRATSPTLVTPVLGAATGTSLSVSGQLTSTVATGTAPLVVTSTTPVANLSIGGNAATVTTNADLTGDVTSSGNATTIGANKVVTGMIADGTIVVGDLADNAVEEAKIKDSAVTSAKIKDGEIVNADLSASAAIADTKLATIATAGKVSNSATTATDANTASAIVSRDANGNFTAGTITANLTGLASKATNLNGGSLGDIAYQSAANTSSFLSGNTSATKKFLTQTGTGSAAVAPAWGTVGTADITDLGANVATFLATPSSVNLFNAMTNKTGTGSLVFNTSPTLFSPILGIASATSVAFSGATSGTATLAAPAVAGTTTITLPGATGTLATLAGTETLTNKTLTSPNIGVATATSINKVTITAPSTGATLTIAEGKTLTANNSIVFAGTDDKTMTFPTTDATIARTDAAQTFTGVQTFSSDMVVNSVNIGRGKGAIATNTAVGTDAISATATGTENAALGYNALKVVTSGSFNTAIGSQAVKSVTSGSNNTALGYQALRDNTTGEANTAIGKEALAALNSSATPNDRNTAIGAASFLNLTSGQFNVGVGQGSLLYATSGSSNIAIGRYAGETSSASSQVTTSNKSIFIGTNTKPLSATSENEIIIGDRAIGLGDNSTVLGNASSTQAKIFGALDLPDATTSTSTTTGALKVGGGVGIVENLNVGGNAKITGTLTVTNGAGAGKVLTSDANGLGTWTTPAGVTTMAAIGSTPNANGATISGVNLNLEPASASYGGIVTTGTQTFAGAKTFSPAVTAASGLAEGTKFTPTLTAAATGDILVGLDINPTFTNGSYTGLTNYALRVQGIGFGRGGGAVETNTAIGSGTLINNTTGANNTGLGYRALISNSIGSGNTAFGTLAGAYIGPTNSTANSSGTNSTFIGYNTSPLANGDDNEVVIAGGNATTRTVGLGSNTTLIGNAATTLTALKGDVAIGSTTDGGDYKLQVTGNTKLTGTLTVTSGAGAGKVLTSDADGLGTWTTSNAVPYTGATGAVNLGSYDLKVNGLTIGKGTNSLNENTALGVNALFGNNSGAGANTAVGHSTLKANTSGTYNTGIGFYALNANSTGNNNTAVGYNSLVVNTGSSNTAVGSNSLSANISGQNNAAFGFAANQTNSAGSNNAAFGYGALSQSTASDNTAVGNQAGNRITSGAKNIFIGSKAGTNAGSGTTLNATGLNSVLIGWDVRPAADGETNQIIIAGANGSAGTVGLGSNSTSIGNSATQKSQLYGALTVVPNAADASTNGNSSTIAAQNAGTGGTNAGGSVNITAGNGNSTGLGGNIVLTPGTSTTAANKGIVTVNGQVKIADGTQGAGKVLTSDANGLATWTNASGSAVTTDTAAYTITLAESIVFYTGSAAGTFSIPTAASTNLGKEITIKNKTAFNITITPVSGTIYIDNANTGAASVSIGIEASNNWIKLVSDGSQWNVLRALF